MYKIYGLILGASKTHDQMDIELSCYLDAGTDLAINPDYFLQKNGKWNGQEIYEVMTGKRLVHT